jgi:hypothetical protein
MTPGPPPFGQLGYFLRRSAAVHITANLGATHLAFEMWDQMTLAAQRRPTIVISTAAVDWKDLLFASRRVPIESKCRKPLTAHIVL